MNEAVTNALKYAFPDDHGGSIRVTLARAPSNASTMILAVVDDGVGPGSGAPKGTGLGQRLMRSMAAQLSGTLSLDRVEGRTVARLRFPAG